MCNLFFVASSQLSQRLKMTYKTSTSRIVSSFRPVSAGWRMVREYRGHRDGVWEVNVSHTDAGIIGTASAGNTNSLALLINCFITQLMQYYSGA